MKNTISTLGLSAILATAGTDSLPPLSICPTPHHHDHASHSTPIGVMGGHVHNAGEWMFSYRYMFMNMEDNYLGNNKISISDVFTRGYMVSPVNMQMEMHMLGAMYAPSDRITLMGMVNLVNMEMLHQTSPMAQMMMGMPQNFSTSSSGLGDATVGALMKLYDTDHSSLHLGLNALLPTAETDKEDMIGGMQQTLPYPMQLGSGSWGLKPSLTYLAHSGRLSFGAQVSGNIYLADNDNDYRLGDSLSATTWTSYNLLNNLNASLRAQYTTRDNIDGQHNTLNNLPVPTVDTSLRGGQKLDLYVGLDYLIEPLNLKVAAEVGQTVWQELDGPQLGSDWNLIVGASVSF